MSSMKKQLLLMKRESSYGTDPTPTASLNAAKVSGLTIVPLEMDSVAPDYALGDFSKDASFPGQRRARVSFSWDFRPAATAGTAPDIAAALRACGFAETVTADTSVEYTEVSESIDSVTFYTWAGGTKHVLTGARGTVTLQCQPGQLPQLQFEFTGLYATPTDTALPDPTFPDMLAPVTVSKAATAFTYNAVQLVLHQLTLQLGNQVVFRDKPNYAGVDIDDRTPGGQLSVHQAALASANLFTDAAVPNLRAVALTHTVAVGRSASVALAKTQVESPTYAADGQLRLVQANLATRRNPSGPDISILFT
ncbi:hypothetical protein sos41_31280 [Alphaproteobacteria bacterium SO-S41]|nr:hypothetical protein sos41_31280 [Alphaproteobacteria bacterium SO-S41]